jgi:hypothetical protein
MEIIITDKTKLLDTIHNSIDEWNYSHYPPNEIIYCILMHRMLFYEIFSKFNYIDTCNYITILPDGKTKLFGYKVITTCDISENAFVIL